MKLPKFEFIQPHSLQEACSILGEHDRKAAILAGGTALMVSLRYRLSKPAVVIGLKGLTALDYVGRNGSGGLAIGSMVTLETLEKSPLVLNEYPSWLRLSNLWPFLLSAMWPPSEETSVLIPDASTTISPSSGEARKRLASSWEETSATQSRRAGIARRFTRVIWVQF